MRWRINRIQYPVYNLGPGRRIGIWTQGCPIRCAGCVNTELWDEHGGQEISVDRLASEIASLRDQFDGITITGGEPFAQYGPLVAFSSFIRQQTRMTIFVYTGYTLAQLEQKFPDRLFARCINYLMDGPYVAERSCNDPLKGSDNQRLHFPAGDPGQFTADPGKTLFSVKLADKGQVFMAGIPRKNALETLSRRMTATGINFETS